MTAKDRKDFTAREVKAAARRARRRLANGVDSAGARKLRRAHPSYNTFLKVLDQVLVALEKAPTLTAQELQMLSRTGVSLLIGFAGGMSRMLGEPPVETEPGPGGDDSDRPSDPWDKYSKCIDRCLGRYDDCQRGPVSIVGTAKGSLASSQSPGGDPVRLNCFDEYLNCMLDCGALAPKK